MRASISPNRRHLGLLRRREFLVPTMRGWLLILLISVSLVLLTIREAYPFLAVTSPVSGGDLVVEGWVSDGAFDKAILEFKRNPYRKLYVTGGPIEQGASLLGYTTYAEFGAAVLRSKGLSPDSVQAVPAAHVDRDRTYASAMALKDWQREHGVTPGSYHIMSVGPHARRTRLLFEEALGEGVVVGITAIDDPSYDSKRWWKSSAGVRTVLGEAIAYIYARLLFRPLG